MHIKKFLTLTVTAVYAATNCVLLNAAEANIWQERRAGFERDQAPVQLAYAFPKISHGTVPSVPSSVKPILPPQFESLPKAHQSIVERIPSRLGNIRDVASDPSGKNKKTLILIQDIHQNREAQKNIASLISHLQEKSPLDFVALEGADGPIVLDEFREPSHKAALRSAADYLLRENKISGAVYAGLTLPAEPVRMEGIDSPSLHKRNVSAYLKSRPLAEQARKILKEKENGLLADSMVRLSPTLRKFDFLVRRHQSGELELGAYVAELGRYAPLSSNLQTFSQAVQLEKEMDFEAVERERGRLLEALTPALSPPEKEALIRMGVAFRSADLSAFEFYKGLSTLTEAKGISLSRYPSFDQFIRYVLLADRVSGQEMFSELKRLEDRIYSSLISNFGERSLVESLRLTRYQLQLAAFSLTRADWDSYRSIRGSAAPDFMAPFEDFYLAARARDEEMASRILKVAGARENVFGAVVAGGFHSDGLKERLEKSGFNTLIFIPKISEVPDQGEGAYLSAFAQEKTPLEKLVAGQPLFLAQNPALGIPLLTPLEEAVRQGVLKNQSRVRLEKHTPLGAVEYVVELEENPGKTGDEAPEIKSVTSEAFVSPASTQKAVSARWSGRPVLAVLFSAIVISLIGPLFFNRGMPGSSFVLSLNPYFGFFSTIFLASGLAISAFAGSRFILKKISKRGEGKAIRKLFLGISFFILTFLPAFGGTALADNVSPLQPTSAAMVSVEEGESALVSKDLQLKLKNQSFKTAMASIGAQYKENAIGMLRHPDTGAWDYHLGADQLNAVRLNKKGDMVYPAGGTEYQVYLRVLASDFKGASPEVLRVINRQSEENREKIIGMLRHPETGNWDYRLEPEHLDSLTKNEEGNLVYVITQNGISTPYEAHLTVQLEEKEFKFDLAPGSLDNVAAGQPQEIQFERTSLSFSPEENPAVIRSVSQNSEPLKINLPNPGVEAPGLEIEPELEVAEFDAPLDFPQAELNLDASLENETAVAGSEKESNGKPSVEFKRSAPVFFAGDKSEGSLERTRVETLKPGVELALNPSILSLEQPPIFPELAGPNVSISLPDITPSSLRLEMEEPELQTEPVSANQDADVAENANQGEILKEKDVFSGIPETSRKWGVPAQSVIAAALSLIAGIFGLGVFLSNRKTDPGLARASGLSILLSGVIGGSALYLYLTPAWAGFLPGGVFSGLAAVSGVLLIRGFILQARILREREERDLDLLFASKMDGPTLKEEFSLSKKENSAAAEIEKISDVSDAIEEAPVSQVAQPDLSASIEAPSFEKGLSPVEKKGSWGRKVILALALFGIISVGTSSWEKWPWASNPPPSAAFAGEQAQPELKGESSLAKNTADFLKEAENLIDELSDLEPRLSKLKQSLEREWEAPYREKLTKSIQGKERELEENRALLQGKQRELKALNEAGTLAFELDVLNGQESEARAELSLLQEQIARLKKTPFILPSQWGQSDKLSPSLVAGLESVDRYHRPAVVILLQDPEKRQWDGYLKGLDVKNVKSVETLSEEEKKKFAREIEGLESGSPVYIKEGKLTWVHFVSDDVKSRQGHISSLEKLAEEKTRFMGGIQKQIKDLEGRRNALSDSEDDSLPSLIRSVEKEITRLEVEILDLEKTLPGLKSLAFSPISLPWEGELSDEARDRLLEIKMLERDARALLSKIENLREEGGVNKEVLTSGQIRILDWATQLGIARQVQLGELRARVADLRDKTIYRRAIESLRAEDAALRLERARLKKEAEFSSEKLNSILKSPVTLPNKPILAVSSWSPIEDYVDQAREFSEPVFGYIQINGGKAPLTRKEVPFIFRPQDVTPEMKNKEAGLRSLTEYFSRPFYRDPKTGKWGVVFTNVRFEGRNLEKAQAQAELALAERALSETDSALSDVVARFAALRNQNPFTDRIPSVETIESELWTAQAELNGLLHGVDVADLRNSIPSPLPWSFASFDRKPISVSEKSEKKSVEAVEASETNFPASPSVESEGKQSVFAVSSVNGGWLAGLILFVIFGLVKMGQVWKETKEVKRAAARATLLSVLAAPVLWFLSSNALSPALTFGASIVLVVGLRFFDSYSGRSLKAEAEKEKWKRQQRPKLGARKNGSRPYYDYTYTTVNESDVIGQVRTAQPKYEGQKEPWFGWGALPPKPAALDDEEWRKIMNTELPVDSGEGDGDKTVGRGKYGRYELKYPFFIDSEAPNGRLRDPQEMMQDLVSRKDAFGNRIKPDIYTLFEEPEEVITFQEAEALNFEGVEFRLVRGDEVKVISKEEALRLNLEDVDVVKQSRFISYEEAESREFRGLNFLPYTNISLYFANLDPYDPRFRDIEWDRTAQYDRRSKTRVRMHLARMKKSVEKWRKAYTRFEKGDITEAELKAATDKFWDEDFQVRIEIKRRDGEPFYKTVSAILVRFLDEIRYRQFLPEFIVPKSRRKYQEIAFGSKARHFIDWKGENPYKEDRYGRIAFEYSMNDGTTWRGNFDFGMRSFDWQDPDMEVLDPETGFPKLPADEDMRFIFKPDVVIFESKWEPDVEETSNWNLGTYVKSLFTDVREEGGPPSMIDEFIVSWGLYSYGTSKVADDQDRYDRSDKDYVLNYSPFFADLQDSEQAKDWFFEDPEISYGLDPFLQDNPVESAVLRPNYSSRQIGDVEEGEDDFSEGSPDTDYDSYEPSEGFDSRSFVEPFSLAAYYAYWMVKQWGKRKANRPVITERAGVGSDLNQFIGNEPLGVSDGASKKNIAASEEKRVDWSGIFRFVFITSLYLVLVLGFPNAAFADYGFDARTTFWYLQKAGALATYNAVAFGALGGYLISWVYTKAQPAGRGYDWKFTIALLTFSPLVAWAITLFMQSSMLFTAPLFLISIMGIISIRTIMKSALDINYILAALFFGFASGIGAWLPALVGAGMISLIFGMASSVKFGIQSEPHLQLNMTWKGSRRQLRLFEQEFLWSITEHSWLGKQGWTRINRQRRGSTGDYYVEYRLRLKDTSEKAITQVLERINNFHLGDGEKLVANMHENVRPTENDLLLVIIESTLNIFRFAFGLEVKRVANRRQAVKEYGELARVFDVTAEQYDFVKKETDKLENEIDEEWSKWLRRQAIFWTPKVFYAAMALSLFWTYKPGGIGYSGLRVSEKDVYSSDYGQSWEGPAVAVADNVVDQSFLNGGQVSHVLVRNNQHVEKGDLIATLLKNEFSPERLQAAKLEAMAEYEEERAIILQDQQTLAIQADRANTNRIAAKANLKQLEIQISQQETLLREKQARLDRLESQLSGIMARVIPRWEVTRRDTLEQKSREVNGSQSSSYSSRQGVSAGPGNLSVESSQERGSQSTSGWANRTTTGNQTTREKFGTSRDYLDFLMDLDQKQIQRDMDAAGLKFEDLEQYFALREEVEGLQNEIDDNNDVLAAPDVSGRLRAARKKLDARLARLDEELNPYELLRAAQSGRIEFDNDFDEKDDFSDNPNRNPRAFRIYPKTSQIVIAIKEIESKDKRPQVGNVVELTNKVTGKLEGYARISYVPDAKKPAPEEVWGALQTSDLSTLLNPAQQPPLVFNIVAELIPGENPEEWSEGRIPDLFHNDTYVARINTGVILEDSYQTKDKPSEEEVLREIEREKGPRSFEQHQLEQGESFEFNLDQLNLNGLKPTPAYDLRLAPGRLLTGLVSNGNAGTYYGLDGRANILVEFDRNLRVVREIDLSGLLRPGETDLGSRVIRRLPDGRFALINNGTENLSSELIFISLDTAFPSRNLTQDLVEIFALPKELGDASSFALSPRFDKVYVASENGAVITPWTLGRKADEDLADELRALSYPLSRDHLGRALDLVVAGRTNGEDKLLILAQNGVDSTGLVKLGWDRDGVKRRLDSRLLPKSTPAPAALALDEEGIVILSSSQNGNSVFKLTPNGVSSLKPAADAPDSSAPIFLPRTRGAAPLNEEEKPMGLNLGKGNQVDPFALTAPGLFDGGGYADASSESLILNWDEISSLALNEETGTLYATDDEQKEIIELSAAGNIKRIIAGFPYEDGEAIVWLGGTRVGVLIEKQRKLVVAELPETGRTFSGETRVFDLPPEFLEGEGLAYDAKNGLLYIGNEDGPAVVRVEIPEDGNELIQKGALKTPRGVKLSGLTWDSQTDRLLMLTKGNNPEILEIAVKNEGKWKEGDVISRFSLKPFGLKQPEGIAMDPDSRTIYVTSEGIRRVFNIFTPKNNQGALPPVEEKSSGLSLWPSASGSPFLLAATHSGAGPLSLFMAIPLLLATFFQYIRKSDDSLDQDEETNEEPVVNGHGQDVLLGSKDVLVLTSKNTRALLREGRFKKGLPKVKFFKEDGAQEDIEFNEISMKSKNLRFVIRASKPGKFEMVLVQFSAVDELEKKDRIKIQTTPLFRIQEDLIPDELFGGLNFREDEDLIERALKEASHFDYQYNPLSGENLIDAALEKKEEIQRYKQVSLANKEAIMGGLSDSPSRALDFRTIFQSETQAKVMAEILIEYLGQVREGDFKFVSFLSGGEGDYVLRQIRALGDSDLIKRLDKAIMDMAERVGKDLEEDVDALSLDDLVKQTAPKDTRYLYSAGVLFAAFGIAPGSAGIVFGSPSVLAVSLGLSLLVLEWAKKANLSWVQAQVAGSNAAVFVVDDSNWEKLKISVNRSARRSDDSILVVYTGSNPEKVRRAFAVKSLLHYPVSGDTQINLDQILENAKLNGSFEESLRQALANLLDHKSGRLTTLTTEDVKRRLEMSPELSDLNRILTFTLGFWVDSERPSLLRILDTARVALKQA